MDLIDRGVCQANVGKRKLRIRGQRLLVQLDRMGICFGTSILLFVTRQQEQPVGLRVFGAAGGETLNGIVCEANSETLGYGTGDVLLDADRILEWTVVFR